MIGRMAATGAASFGLYLAFAGSLTPSEIGAGVAVALAIVSWTEAARRASRKPYRFAWEDLRGFGAGIAGLPASTWRTGRALLRALAAGVLPVRIQHEPFAGGGERDPRDRARRAVALFARSLGPDGFVLSMQRGRDEIVVHALRREGDGR